MTNLVKETGINVEALPDDTYWKNFSGILIAKAIIYLAEAITNGFNKIYGRLP